jgi:hypothetical protein
VGPDASHINKGPVAVFALHPVFAVVNFREVGVESLPPEKCLVAKFAFHFSLLLVDTYDVPEQATPTLELQWTLTNVIKLFCPKNDGAWATRVFNNRSDRMFVMHLFGYEAKQPNLKLKTRPKQLLDYLPLALALPCQTGFL